MNQLDITVAEDAIVDRLREKLGGVAIEAFPDNPSQYKLTHAKGAILVRYHGSAFEESRIDGLICQLRNVRFDLIAVARSLRKSDGVYDLVKKTLAALTGFEMPTGEKMSAYRDEFIREEKGIWQHGMQFRFSCQHNEE